VRRNKLLRDFVSLLADTRQVARWMVAIAVLLFATRASAEDLMPNAVPTVMYKPWAASVTYGVSGERANSGDPEVLFFFELALRYRVVPQFEIGGSLGGSLSRTDGFATIELDLRYRFMAEMPWNPFMYAGIGIASFGAGNGPYPVVRAGAGVERRFKQWAFDARLEVTGVAADADAPNDNGVMAASLGMSALYYWGSGGPNLRHHGVP
jgi:hypothetical protein